ncbi:general transcription factor 3C polypeptide 5, putative, partial [Plasmodium malariae]
MHAEKCRSRDDSDEFLKIKRKKDRNKNIDFKKIKKNEYICVEVPGKIKKGGSGLSAVESLGGLNKITDIFYYHKNSYQYDESLVLRINNNDVFSSFILANWTKVNNVLIKIKRTKKNRYKFEFLGFVKYLYYFDNMSDFYYIPTFYNRHNYNSNYIHYLTKGRENAKKKEKEKEKEKDNEKEKEKDNENKHKYKHKNKNPNQNPNQNHYNINYRNNDNINTCKENYIAYVTENINFSPFHLNGEEYTTGSLSHLDHKNHHKEGKHFISNFPDCSSYVFNKGKERIIANCTSHHLNMTNRNMQTNAFVFNNNKDMQSGISSYNWASPNKAIIY